ncbi:MAG: hemolysin III family protein [Gammaproteobacteria bacterium]|nr:hemolysin III family protein [Gammaproteobacteria bacterium]
MLRTGPSARSVAAGRDQSPGEEIANAVSHAVGALAAVAAIPVLLVNSVAGGSPAVEIFAVSLFGVSMVGMYVISALYHALPGEPRSGAVGATSRSRLESRSHSARSRLESRSYRAKRVFWLLDHSAIYVLIAGTYTPFALGVFKEAWGWPMFALVWGLAAAGVLLKALGGGRHPIVSSGLYLGMGWLVLAAAGPLFDVLPFAGFLWLLAGGVAYTLGVVFFALDERVRYAHFIWHLFVLTGTACHFVAVLGYA